MMIEIEKVFECFLELKPMFAQLIRKKIPSVDVEEFYHNILVREVEKVSQQYDASRGASLKTYVGTLARYMIVDEIRNRCRSRNRFAANILLTDELEYAQTKPETACERRGIDAERLAHCVEQLTPTQREVLRRYLDGEKMREIGESRGCTDTNICHIIHQAAEGIRLWYEYYRVGRKNGLSAPVEIVKLRAFQPQTLPEDAAARVLKHTVAVVAARSGVSRSTLWKVVYHKYKTEKVRLILQTLYELEDSK